MFVKACDKCQRTKIESLQYRSYSPKVLVDYSPMEGLFIDIKLKLKGFNNYKYLLVTICQITNFVPVIPIESGTTQIIAEALILDLYACLVHQTPHYG